MPAFRHLALGLHIGHDRCAALVADGNVIAAVAEERLDRRKHSAADALPILSIDYVLRFAGVKTNQISSVAFTHAGCPVISEIEENWQREIASALDLRGCPVTMIGHHFAHACSAFYTSPFCSAAVAVADGGGDILNDAQSEAESYYLAGDHGIFPFATRFQGNTIKYGTPLAVERFDYMPSSIRDAEISIGRKYQQITQLLGFKFGEAGKTMGLAPYGTPLLSFQPPVPQLNFNLRYGDYLEQLDEAQRKSGLPYSTFLRYNRARIAFDIQDFASATLTKLLRHLHRETGQSAVCLAGGVFLNCVANTRILRESGFDDVYIVPPAGDDGQAIGAALHAYHLLVPGRREPMRFSPFLGKTYDDSEAIEQAQIFGHPFRVFNDADDLASELAQALVAGKTVGICRGRSEVGPRSLGHRSILASPLIPTMKDFINQEIKYREDFRPFAPMVKADAAARFFDLAVPSPYMLLTAQVKAEHRTRLVGVTHVDGSARIQTIEQADDPFLYNLLDHFEALTGYPIVINTSFNTGGEPIVETPRDAFLTFRQTALTLLAFERTLVWK